MWRVGTVMAGALAIATGCGSSDGGDDEATPTNGDPPMESVVDPGTDDPGTMGDPGMTGDPAMVDDPTDPIEPAVGVVPVPPQPPMQALPDIVHMKTNTLSFNALYYFGVLDGRLYAKPNVELTGNDGDWLEMTLPPGLAGRVGEISTDDFEIIALDVDRQIWVGVGVLGALNQVTWKSEWGFPFGTGPGYSLPPSDRLTRWEWVSIGSQTDLCRPDIAGNCHSPGSANVSHIWMLFSDGQRLQYTDPWLPADTSYGSCTPHRGQLAAMGFAGSGSHIFVINATGDMFTRLYDFDLSGGNNVFVQYSYYPQPPGSAVHQLPPHDWMEHPKIDGTITNQISLHKIGTQGINRVMRVEGTDTDGNSGYWEKDITEMSPGAWAFHRTDAPLHGTHFLDNGVEDRSADGLGRMLDRRFSHNMAQLDAIAGRTGVAYPDIAIEVLDFNPLCSPSTLRVHFGPTDSLDLVLHTVDPIRLAPRAEGLDATPRTYDATVEVPAATLLDLSSLSPRAREFVRTYLGDQQYTSFPINATSDALVADLGFAGSWELR